MVHPLPAGTIEIGDPTGTREPNKGTDNRYVMGVTLTEHNPEHPRGILRRKN